MSSVINSKEIPFNQFLYKSRSDGKKPYMKDDKKVLLLVIDMQMDFMDEGSLPVPGANADAKRLSDFIYKNSDNITKIAASLDTHSHMQIFHPSWWQDDKGNWPEPYTKITSNDLSKGRWIPIKSTEKSIKYIDKLEENNDTLIIWPFHCIEGTSGFSLNNNFSSALYYHAARREYSPLIISKGHDKFSEMHGILFPEYDPDSAADTRILNEIVKSDVVLIAGQAKSHCVLNTIGQILEFFEDSPDITEKLSLMDDCTSCVPGYEEETNSIIDSWKNKYGLNITKSNEFFKL